MPRKSDTIAINNEQLDRRVKLTTEKKEEIIELYKTGLYSINGLARTYNVSKRSIQFTLFPERAEKAKERLKECLKEKRYYDKDKHALYTKNHREYKNELFLNGKIGQEENNNG